MSKPFDASPKALVQLRPAEWLAFLGVEAQSVQVVDADVSTVTAAADKLLRVSRAGREYIEQLDFQAGPDTLLPQRLHVYNALLEQQHDLPVSSTVVLLRRQANLRSINGAYTRSLPEAGESYLRFHYRVIRLWQMPVEQVLTAGLSLLQLAGLCDVEQRELPGIIARMRQRLDREADPPLAAELWTATDVLLGLRYEQHFIDRLLQGVRAMKESVTYQAILEEGRKEGREEGRAVGMREVLLHQGTRKFRTLPPEEVRVHLEQLSDLAELQRLSDRLLEVDSWAELLPPASPSSTSRSRRKKSL